MKNKSKIKIQMARFLVIVESTGKIKKIKSILGSEYDVVASCGHIHSTDVSRFDEMVKTGKVLYVISKKKIVAGLKKRAKGKTVLLPESPRGREARISRESPYSIVSPTHGPKQGPTFR